MHSAYASVVCLQQPIAKTAIFVHNKLVYACGSTLQGCARLQVWSQVWSVFGVGMVCSGTPVADMAPVLCSWSNLKPRPMHTC